MGLGNLNHELFLLGHQHKLTQMLTKDEWNLEGTIEDRKHTELITAASETKITREQLISLNTYYVNPFDLEVLTDNDLEKSMGGQRNLM